MIYLCEDCKDIFKKPNYRSVYDDSYKNNIYTSRHCPNCDSENMVHCDNVYYYKDYITHSDDEIYGYLQRDYPKATNDELESLFVSLVDVYD